MTHFSPIDSNGTYHCSSQFKWPKSRSFLTSDPPFIFPIKIGNIYMASCLLRNMSITKHYWFYILTVAGISYSDPEIPWLADTTPILGMCTEIMHYIDSPLVILIYYLFFSIKANWNPHLFSQCKQTFPASSLSKFSYRNLSLILFGQVSRGMDMLIPAGGISQCRSFELGAVQLLESLLLTWETWKQLIVADIAGINHYVDGLYLCLLEWKRLSSSYIFSLYCRSPCPNMAETSTTTEQVLTH